MEDVVELSHGPDKVFHRRLQIVEFPLVLQKLVVFSRTVYAQFGDELLTKPAKVKPLHILNTDRTNSNVVLSK